MHPSEILGILLSNNKTFYYLETGNFKLMNVIERLRSVLLARGLLTILSEEQKLAYSVLTLEEAKKYGYTIEPIFLNAHIKKHTKQLASEADTGKKAANPWKR